MGRSEGEVTHILGISAYYHDSAAALLKDGDLVAAAQQERFSRKKHDARFPREAISYCLGSEGLRIEEALGQKALLYPARRLFKFK